MAPAPIQPVPPSPDAFLAPDQREAVRQALWRAHGETLEDLHAQHENGRAILEATLDAGGRPMVIAVLVEPQVQAVYRGLIDLLGKAHYPVPRAGKLSIALWDDRLPSIPELIDSHMCEMAPDPIPPFEDE